MKHFPFVLLLASALPSLAAPREIPLKPVFSTSQVADDSDDPAIWIHPKNHSQSLIIGTNKVEFPKGALYVFNLNGKTRQIIPNLARPNNVDVEYGFKLGAKTVDIAVATERQKRALRIYSIENGRLRDIAPKGLPVFSGEKGEKAAPMGIALYKRPRDGAIFAVVSRKEGPKSGYLWQYRLQSNAKGQVSAIKVRELGSFSGKGEIESVVADDELGVIYYSDEGRGYRKWAADPASPLAKRELAVFGTKGISGDREGLAIYSVSGGKGFVLATEQLETQSPQGGSLYRVYPRLGLKQNPQELQPLAILHGKADETDGIEAVSTPLGARFPKGALVAMNSKDRNFLVYSLSELAKLSPER